MLILLCIDKKTLTILSKLVHLETRSWKFWANVLSSRRLKITAGRQTEKFERVSLRFNFAKKLTSSLDIINITLTVAWLEQRTEIFQSSCSEASVLQQTFVDLPLLSHLETFVVSFLFIAISRHLTARDTQHTTKDKSILMFEDKWPRSFANFAIAFRLVCCPCSYSSSCSYSGTCSFSCSCSCSCSCSEGLPKYNFYFWFSITIVVGDAGTYMHTNRT